MTIQYSAGENNTRSKLAIMTTLPDAKETITLGYLPLKQWLFSLEFHWFTLSLPSYHQFNIIWYLQLHVTKSMVSWDYPFHLWSHVHIHQNLNIHSWINPFNPNGLFNPYQKDEHIFKFRGGGIFRFSSHFNRTLCVANSGDPDQMQGWHFIWVCPVSLRRPA